MENDSNPYRYAGEYFDKEKGTIYLRARYYNPTVGRFSTVDPIRDGLNWYAYCNNNPVVFVDYDGKSPTVAFVVGGAVVGGFIGALSQITINFINGNVWHEGVAASALGGTVYSTVFATTLNVAAAAYSGAAATATYNAVMQINDGIDVPTAIGDAVLSTALDGTISYVINNGVGIFIKTNNGWFQPKTLFSFFSKKYGQQIVKQSLAAGEITIATASLIINGKPNVDGLRELLGVDENENYKLIEKVRSIQTKLAEEGYLPYNKVNGVWDLETDAAFVSYMQSNVSFLEVE